MAERPGNRRVKLDPEQSNENQTRYLPPGMYPLMSLDDLATVLNCSRWLVERMRAAGKVPRPDMKVGRMPRWRVAPLAVSRTGQQD